jgi:hypothetical protein
MNQAFKVVLNLALIIMTLLSSLVTSAHDSTSINCNSVCNQFHTTLEFKGFKTKKPTYVSGYLFHTHPTESLGEINEDDEECNRPNIILPSILKLLCPLFDCGAHGKKLLHISLNRRNYFESRIATRLTQVHSSASPPYFTLSS